MIKIISWNLNWYFRRDGSPWRCLPDSGADIALLQEAGQPPVDVAKRIEVDPAPFPDETNFKSRSAIAKLSDRVKIKWLTPVPLKQRESEDHFEVTHPYSISAAIVTPSKGKPFTVISFAAEYEYPYHSNCGITDAAVHRIISDLSLFMGCTRKHPRIIAAGDLSVWRGYGGFGGAESDYWEGRYDTVFDRMEAIGMPLVGPEAPNGRQVKPRPYWLPEDTKNVPTYRHSSGVEHQLDFVFATESMKDSVKKVTALNYPDDWGPKPPSDHCQIEILVEP